ncbi:MAG: DUF1573 domain-containing protein [Isosphaeraceae bacterium]
MRPMQLGKVATRIVLPASALLLFAGLMAAGLLGRVGARGSARPDRPVMSINPPRHDFGRVKPLEALQADFTIKNSGSRTLVLGPPTATCGCQKPTLDRSTVPPGGWAMLRIEQRARDSSGTFTHAIIIRSNDPVSPEVFLPLFGVVSKGVVVNPEPVYLGELRAGEVRSREVEVASDDGIPFRITHCASLGNLSVDAEKGVSRLLHRVSVSFRGGPRLGPFEERFVVNTDRPGSIPLVIPVRGEVTGPYKVSPSILWLGNIPGDSESQASLVATCDAGALRVDEVRMEPGGWSVQHTIAAADERARVRKINLKIHVPNATGFLESSLRIKLSKGGAEPATIVVPVTATARATALSANAEGRGEHTP